MRWRCGVVLVGVWASALLPLTARAQTDNGIAIRDNFYVPAELTIQLGDSVTWTNEGAAAHTVTSEGFFDSSPNCLGGVVGCMQPGDSFTISFDAAGTYRYICKIHGEAMSGRIFVQATTTSTTSTPTSATSTLPTTTTLPGQQSSAAPQQLPPTITTGPRVALPKRIDGVTVHDRSSDDNRRRFLALVDIAIAGATAISGIVLVRRGRVPFG